MADVIVSLLAQFDEAHIVRDLAKRAGYRVAVKYSDRFRTSTRFRAITPESDRRVRR
jgi:plasmid stabilization system protein ParE